MWQEIVKFNSVSSPLWMFFAVDWIWSAFIIGTGIFVVIGSCFITRFLLARSSFAFIRVFIPLLFSLDGQHCLCFQHKTISIRNASKESKKHKYKKKKHVIPPNRISSCKKKDKRQLGNDKMLPLRLVSLLMELMSWNRTKWKRQSKNANTVIK